MSVVDLLTATAAGGRGPERIFGVVVGIVRDIKDPDGFGRVKVDFPWMGEATEAVTVGDQDDRAHSFWARIATLFAGSGRGSFFIPEVGDEVLVAFEHGDPNRPFVLGGLWNSEDTPPETMDADGKNHLRSFTSRSGHVITMDDNTDDQKAKVVITSQGGHQVTLDDDGGKGKIELKTNAGHQITLDDDGGTLTISDKSGNKLEFDANAGSLTVEASGNTDQTVGGNLNITVSGSATISAPSGITLDSSSVKLGTGASLALANETLLTIFNTHFHVGNLGAPTSPPTVPAIPGAQSTVLIKGA
ncbi:MAG: phage tail protein [Geobacter sp.]|nr:phage tail protein [Geobacter sp.]